MKLTNIDQLVHQSIGRLGGNLWWWISTYNLPRHIPFFQHDAFSWHSMVVDFAMYPLSPRPFLGSRPKATPARTASTRRGARWSIKKMKFNQQKWDFNGILTGFELDLINNIWILPMNTGDGFVLNRFKKEIPQSGDFNGGNDDFLSSSAFSPLLGVHGFHSFGTLNTVVV